MLSRLRRRCDLHTETRLSASPWLPRRLGGRSEELLTFMRSNYISRMSAHIYESHNLRHISNNASQVKRRLIGWLAPPSRRLPFWNFNSTVNLKCAVGIDMKFEHLAAMVEEVVRYPEFFIVSLTWKCSLNTVQYEDCMSQYREHCQSRWRSQPLCRVFTLRLVILEGN